MPFANLFTVQATLSVVGVVLFAILGCILGSFIATLVVRWPSGESFIQGRSRCDQCGKTLSARDLVPLLSFAWLRGRARCCSEAIARIHPTIEILASLIGVASYLVLSGNAFTAAIFGWLLLTVGALDARTFWIPNQLILLLGGTGLLVTSLLDPASLTDHLIGMLGGFSFLVLIGWGYQKLRGREGLGGADPKLLGAIGAWTGWVLLPWIVIIAAVMGLVVAVAMQIAGRSITPATKMPFGTLLASAAWPVWLWSQAASII